MFGFILYPGVPNTTHVMQETDRNYGPFKTKFMSNLDTIVSERIAAGKSLSLQPKLVRLPVFGGEDLEMGCMIPMGAFQARFLQERCLNAWAKIGAATSTGKITRACLSDKQAMREVGDVDADDDKDCLCWKVRTANTLAVDALVRAGYDGELLRATLKPKEMEERPLTQPGTKERQQLLPRAKNAGQRHMATGGCHLTHDNMLISIEMASRCKDAGEIEKEKKLRLGQQASEESARAILALGKPANDIKGVNLDVLLKWHQVKMEKGEKVPDKRRVWKEIVKEGRSPPSYKKWTEEDKERLMATSKSDLTLADTRFGRAATTKKRELEASVDFMSQEERDRMIRKSNELNKAEALATATGRVEEHTVESGEVDGV